MPDLTQLLGDRQAQLRNLMNRRDFLHLRALAHAASQVPGALDDLQPIASSLGTNHHQDESALVRFSRPAMATTFEVILPWGLRHSWRLAALALDEIERLEEQLTVYGSTSDISRLNQLAAYTSLIVEENLFQLLEEAARLHAATEGAFDITAGALIKAWGFFQGPRRVPSSQELSAALSCVGMRHVVLNPSQRTVRYAQLGLEINLGSIGKGYALDRAARLLRQEGLVSGLLHGGYSSVCALGTELGHERGWPVAIRHPWEPVKRLTQVYLRDRGLATSAATFQHLEYQDRKLGHIIDPRSGWPASSVDSVTVIAPTAAEADALATAFYILGLDRAHAYCNAHAEIGAILLPAGATDPEFLGCASSMCAADG